MGFDTSCEGGVDRWLDVQRFHVDIVRCGGRVDGLCADEDLSESGPVVDFGRIRLAELNVEFGREEYGEVVWGELV